ncbi:MAG: flavin reductase family protein [Gemmatimonadales bacterium]|nr:flavin reductase family protein [Gemmatimonadales bacterium]
MPLKDVDPAEFRQLCGHFATGVVVITALAADGTPAGMTANSFASVSLTPPLISVNVDHANDMNAILRQSKSFAINVLTISQEAISRRFALNMPRRFDGVGYRIEEPGLVFLDGCLATMACLSQGSFEAGDHTIFVGRVVGGNAAQGRPLMYYRGGYVTVGLP